MVFSRNRRNAGILLESSVTGNAEGLGVARSLSSVRRYTLERLLGEGGHVSWDPGYSRLNRRRLQAGEMLDILLLL